MKYRAYIIVMVTALFLLVTFIYTSRHYMIVKVDDSTSIQFVRLNKGIKLTFGHGGINEIESIESLELYNNIYTQVFDRPQDWLITSSDWIGPLIVGAMENEDIHAKEKFTGGWHGSRGDDTGNPTAKTVEVVLLADGKAIQDKGYLLSQELKIIVKNQIKGYNSLERYIIEEKVTYTIKPNKKIDIDVELTALEDIRIDRYYGLQLIFSEDYNTIHYLIKDEHIDTFNQLANPYNAVYSPADTIIIENRNHKNRIHAAIDLETDINNFSHKAEEEPYAFTTNDRKSYFNLINGKPYYLEQGQSYHWKGTYWF